MRRNCTCDHDGSEIALLFTVGFVACYYFMRGGDVSGFVRAFQSANPGKKQPLKDSPEERQPQKENNL